VVSHAELAVAALIKHTEPYGPNNQGLKVLKALQAVMELHKPELMISSSYCVACTINLETVIYPCPTIEAIQKELA
jgi:hypothetical protein